MNESRYRQYDTRRLPREKRIIRIFGAVSYVSGRPVKDQSNKMYRCWNCGFICNTDRDKIGDGVGYVVKDEADKPAVLNLGAASHEFPNSDNSRDVKLCLDTIHDFHLVALDSVGDLVTVMHGFSSNIRSGCPMCGCKQYK